MTRINVKALPDSAGTHQLIAWGKNIKNIQTNSMGNVNAFVFAAVLIICSLGVGCSSEKPKPVASNQTPAPQTQNPAMPEEPAPVMQAENKPAPKKVVHKRPATVNYTDKNYGVSFEYSRRYAIDTGDAAADVLNSSPVPMNFVQPGGVALAAVELPETGFANTDFSSAFFDVSVDKNLTAEQCNEFAVPAPKTPASGITTDSSQPVVQAPANETTSSATDKQSAAASTAATAQPPAEQAASSATVPAGTTAAASDSKTDAGTDSGSKLMLGDLELHATEAVSGEGTRQSDAKYFHVFQNGACYEFALNVTTVASEDGLMKHVNRDRVFDRLEKILATVKIDEVRSPDANTATPATPTVAESPAK